MKHFMTILGALLVGALAFVVSFVVMNLRLEVDVPAGWHTWSDLFISINIALFAAALVIWSDLRARRKSAPDDSRPHYVKALFVSTLVFVLSFVALRILSSGLLPKGADEYVPMWCFVCASIIIGLFVGALQIHSDLRAIRKRYPGGIPSVAPSSDTPRPGLLKALLIGMLVFACVALVLYLAGKAFVHLAFYPALDPVVPHEGDRAAIEHYAFRRQLVAPLAVLLGFLSALYTVRRVRRDAAATQTEIQ